MSITLRAFFACGIALLVIVLSAILSTAIGFISSDKIKEQVGNSLSEVAYQMSNNMDYFMWSRYSEIKVLSELESIKEENNEEAIQKLVNQLSVSIPSFSWVGLTDEKGVVKTATNEILVGTDISERPVFAEAKEETFIGDVHDAVLLAKLLHHPSGEPLQFVDISTPIFNENGEFKGVLAAHLSWEWSKEIQRHVLNPLHGKRKELDIFVVSDKDHTVLLGPSDQIGKKLQIGSLLDAKQNGFGWKIEKWDDKESYVTGYAYGKGYDDYEGLGWTVLVKQSEEQAYVELNELKNSIIQVGTVTAILFAIIGWFWAGFISNPLYKITKSVQALKEGKNEEIPKLKGIKDLEVLSSSLRELINKLTHTEIQLGEMEHLARCDFLTNLPNRMALKVYLNNHVKHSRKDFVFLYMDLDGFKNVNDTLGHHIGDCLLQEVATRIKRQIKQDHFVARLGGDEFVIIALLDSIDDLTQYGTRIIDLLNAPYIIEGHVVKVGSSIGASVWPNGNLTTEQVLQNADRALYESKRMGKNKITIL